MDKVRGELSLGDVLQHLGADAKDLIYKILLQSKSLAATRLSCRSLRDLVDISARHVQFKVGPTHEAVWAAGTPSPLRHLVRCSNVSVDVVAKLGESPWAAGTRLSLPLLGSSQQDLQRITAVHLEAREERDTDAPMPYTAIPGMTLSAVLHRLPALQRLSFFGYVVEDSVGQELALSSLAALAHLEDLDVFTCPALDRIYVMADSSLKRLTLHVFSALSTAMVQGLSRMRRLEHLCYAFDQPDDVETLLLVLSGIPASLQTLKLNYLSILDPRNGFGELDFRLSNGRITSLHFHNVIVTPLDALSRFIGEVLLPSGILGPREERLERLIITDAQWPSLGGDLPAANGAGGDLAPLWQLLRRCENVEVRRLHVPLGTSAQAVQQALAQLEAVQEIILMVDGDCVYDGANGLQLRLTAATQPSAPVAAAAPSAAHATAAAGPRPLPPSLLQLALEELAQAGQLHAAAAASAGAAVSASAPQASGCTRGSVYRQQLVLLRGPLIGSLAWAPEALTAWVRRVLEAAGVPPGGSQPGPPHPFASFLHIPEAEAVVMASPTEAATAAVVAAARTGAAASRTAAAVGGAEALLHALPAAVGVPEDYDLCTSVSDGAVLCAASKAAQRVLDDEGYARGWSRQQRLQWLLEQWTHLCEADVLQVVHLL